MPEKESDPPQFRPRTIFEAGVSLRWSAAARSMKRADLLPRCLHSGPGSAGFLQRQPLQRSRYIGRLIATAKIMTDLVDFTTQTQNERCRNIRMVQHALQRPLQLFGIGTD